MTAGGGGAPRRAGEGGGGAPPGATVKASAVAFASEVTVEVTCTRPCPPTEPPTVVLAPGFVVAVVDRPLPAKPSAAPMARPVAIVDASRVVDTVTVPVE